MKLPVSANTTESEEQQLQWDAIKGVLRGDRRSLVISHPGTSQYAQGEGRGISACGLAALNCARCLLAKANQTPAAAPYAFLHDLSASETIDVSRQLTATASSTHLSLPQEITSICDSWQSNLHLEVDHIYGIPLFQQSLDLVTTKWYSKPGLQEFRNFLS
jgi:hypothetical protein